MFTDHNLHAKSLADTSVERNIQSARGSQPTFMKFSFFQVTSSERYDGCEASWRQTTRSLNDAHFHNCNPSFSSMFSCDAR